MRDDSRDLSLGTKSSNQNWHWRYIPKIIAGGIVIGTGIHAIYHLACDFPRLIHATSDKYVLMEPFFGDQPSNYWHFVKSIEGVTGIVMVVLMGIAFTLASPWLRRSTLTGFNAFWYSHHLFIIVYILLILHGIYLYLTKEWYKKTVSTFELTLTQLFNSDLVWLFWFLWHYICITFFSATEPSADLDVFGRSNRSLCMRKIN